MSESEAVLAKRRADFWTSLVLLVIAAAMIGGALQFPLQGTYAGVRNAWYVSPALLPLIIAGCLAVLALILLLAAIRAGAVQRAFAPRSAAGQLDVLLIGGLIAAFVVCLVPRVDFIVGATLFLFAFTISFHLNHAAVARLALGGFFAVCLLVGGMAFLGLTPAPRSIPAFLLDGAVLLVLVLMAGVSLWRCPKPARLALRQCLGVAFLTPLLLGSIFKFFLLVPLPREGLVVVALDTVRYALRAAL
jgi:hypothetical protein